MFEPALEMIRRFDRIVIHRHSNPDGDALGSQIGLKHLILANFPGKTVYAVGDKTLRYDFMADCVPDVLPDGAFAGALCILLDSSSPALISDSRYRVAAATLRIDHHIFIEKFADTEIVDTSFESCCGMIAALAEEAGLKVPPIAAESLYTGMVTDSGRFRYDCTSARTFRLAAFLLRSPIDLNRLYTNLYTDDYEALKRRAGFILRIRFTEHKVAYLCNTRSLLKELDMDTFAASRGMVNVMADIKGVTVWVNFTEAPEGICCELRSSDRNINPIAVKYGGGGHAKASGATVPDWATAMAMLRDLDEMRAQEG